MIMLDTKAIKLYAMKQTIIDILYSILFWFVPLAIAAGWIIFIIAITNREEPTYWQGKVEQIDTVERMP